MGLRLGFHYHIPVLRDSGGQLRTPGYLGRFLDSLAEQCQRVVCFAHSPRLDELDQMDYVLQAPNIELVSIGPHSSVPMRTLRARNMTRPVRAWRSRLDVLLLRGPSPLLPQMAHAAGDLPTALLLVGDYLAGTDDLPQPRWRKEAIRFWSRWNHGRQTAVAQHSLTFVNSRKLYNELYRWVPNLIETRTTTLGASDFYVRDDTCQGRLVRLLYTGTDGPRPGPAGHPGCPALPLHEGMKSPPNLGGGRQKGNTSWEELLPPPQGLGRQKTQPSTRGTNPWGQKIF